MTKPKLILVTGAPGAGKTTLAVKLSGEIGAEYIDSDAVLEQIWQASKNDSGYDREKTGLPQFLHNIPVAEDVITDPVLRAGLHESIIEELQKKWQLVLIHCRAANASERFYARELGPNGEEPEWLKQSLNDVEMAYATVAEPLQLGIRVIEVDTTDGYRPALDDIAAVVQKT
ncbi:MAG TPA: AAA family ATPase [Candidatus Saccharimonadales bacterium]|jgi:thymidylate kinase